MASASRLRGLALRCAPRCPWSWAGMPAKISLKMGAHEQGGRRSVRVHDGWGLAAALTLFLAGGAEPAWNAERWASTRPELTGRTIGRFGDVNPYLLASEGELVFFVCHWPLDAALRVSMPPDANPDERRILDKALR